MITIFLTGALFFFISTALGYGLVKNWLSLSITTLFDKFLIGISAQLIYCNIWSLFFPTNYLSLVIPSIIAIIVTLRSNYLICLKNEIIRVYCVLSLRQNVIVTLSVIVVLVAFSCVVPYNEDSAGYHYLSILWSEKYKIIPGLANLSAKYGTHSSFFVLSAAYSFSDILGQAVYPLNFVILPSFCFWMLYQSFIREDATKYFLWLMLLVLFRYMLINMASPSPDTLSTVLLFYILYTFISISWKDKCQVMIVLIFTAVILKLNTIPVLLLVLYILLHAPRKNINVTLIAGVLIFVPWLTRSVFISGYPLFPSPYFNLFDVDWKVPAAIAEAEKTHITMAPRLIGEDFLHLKQLGLFQWVPIWYMNLWKHNLVNAALVSGAMISPLFWLISGFRRRDRVRIIVYVLSYIGVWFWILTSPDIRFGIVFKLFCILIPFLFVFDKARSTVISQIVGISMMILACVYYMMIGYSKIPKQFLSQNIFLPPRNAWYYKHNNIKTFRYIMLNDKVKLYVRDSAHHSVNAQLPVFSAPERPGIDTGINVELRGVEVQQGFRYKKRLQLNP